MANNPIETNDFKHFLVFPWGEIEIFEPQGFDASNFVVEQDRGRWGRDTYYGNNESDLVFGDEIGPPRETPITLNDGTILEHLTSGLEFLLQEDRENGPESQVFHKIDLGGSQFTIGQLDFGGRKTDDQTYFKCKVVQNNEQFLIKKREDVKVNLFSSEDLDGNSVTPIQTEKILLKAKPLEQFSRWGDNTTTSHIWITSDDIYFSPFRVVTAYGINDTLSFLTTHTDKRRNLAVVRASYNLTNIRVKIFLRYRLESGGIDPFTLKIGAIDDDNTNFTEFYSEPLGKSEGVIYDYELETTLDASVEIGRYLTVFIQTQNLNNVTVFENSLEITVSSIALNSVIEATRYIDLVKGTFNRVGALPINAPLLQSGGAYFDNFCASGKMIRQILDEPLYSSIKDVVSHFSEFCGDYQINNDEIFIGSYADFYRNVDMGGFLVLPDLDMELSVNERYLINKFNFKYKKFEQDRDEDNTLDAIHTESEWFVPNDNSQNGQKVEVQYIRDAYMIESVRRRALEKETTSNSNDDDIFIFDVTEIAPGTREEFTAVLKWQRTSSDNQLRILADSSFNWTLLGFKVGDVLYITIGSGSVTNYTVLEIDTTVLKLSPVIGTVSNSQGESLLKINYPYTDVLYTVRTGEGLIFSENLLNASNYANLRYSIKRNMRYWYPYLATCGKFIPSKEIKNSYFKSNGACITQFLGEANPIQENAAVPISDITDEKILSQNKINTTVVAEFEEVKTLITNLQTQRGFIRVADHKGRVLKGYPILTDHTWANNEFTLELELKNESDFLVITYDGDTLIINEVGYDQKLTINKTYNIFNNYIQFFDEKYIPLCNRTKASFVEFNGVVYQTGEELANAIESI